MAGKAANKGQCVRKGEYYAVMVRLIFDDWSWRCENCNGMMALPGIVASIEMLKEKDWKFCPYCGKKINFKATEEGSKDFQKIAKGIW